MCSCREEKIIIEGTYFCKNNFEEKFMDNKIKDFLNSIIRFIKEAYIELKKVSWLSKKEVIASTSVVIILIVIVSLYIGLVDFLLSKIVSFLLGGRV